MRSGGSRVERLLEGVDIAARMFAAARRIIRALSWAASFGQPSPDGEISIQARTVRY